MTRFGYHIDPPLAGIPAQLVAWGSATFQTTLRNPHRFGKNDVPDAADQAAYREAAHQVPDLWGMVHATLLTNLAAPDPRVRHGSIGALAGDANLAATLGLSGVCFHAGYQKGYTDRNAAHDVVAAKLGDVAAKLEPGAHVWLENSCEGTELAQTIAEMGGIVRDSGVTPAQVGIVLDTCHLHVAGFDLSLPDAPDRLADELEAQGLTPFLAALHLNDAQFEAGSHRDRHAIPGEGTIGAGLRRLLAHPLFAPLPAILELSAPAAAQGIAYLTAEEQ